MKRMYLALMLGFILLNASGAPAAQGTTSSDRAGAYLIGPIHKVRTESFIFGAAVGEPVESLPFELTISTYNRDGGETEWERWEFERSNSRPAPDSNWKLCQKIITRFDRDGRKTESQWFMYGESWIEHRWVYKPLANGTLVEWLTCDKNGDQVSRAYSTYSSIGEEREEVRIRPDGSVMTKSFFQYDKASRLVGKATYRADGRVLGREVYAYDENGNIVQEDAYDEATDLSQRTVYSGYEFDSTGNWTKRTTSGWHGGGESEALRSGVTPLGISYRTLSYY